MCQSFQREPCKHIVHNVRPSDVSGEEQMICSEVLSALVLWYQMEHEGLDRGLWFHFCIPFMALSCRYFPVSEQLSLTRGLYLHTVAELSLYVTT